MKVLADVNVLLALGDPLHSSHVKVSKWFDSLSRGSEVLLCRVTQASLLRLLATSSVMQGKPLTLQEGWKHVDALIASPGMGFFREAPEVESTWRKLCQPFSASPKVVADAYLGALAIKGNLRFATMDSGFRQFSGLKLVDALLAPQS